MVLPRQAGPEAAIRGGLRPRAVPATAAPGAARRRQAVPDHTPESRRRAIPRRTAPSRHQALPGRTAALTHREVRGRTAEFRRRAVLGPPGRMGQAARGAAACGAVLLAGMCLRVSPAF